MTGSSLTAERSLNRRSFLRILGTGGSVSIGVGLAGCASSGAGTEDGAPVDGTLVEMTDSNTFEPETVEISTGETVVWRNVGAASHTVTAYENEIPAEAAYFASGEFESEGAARDGYTEGTGVVEGGDEYEHAFDAPGRYTYFCIPHESMGMTGTVVVTDGSTAANSVNAAMSQLAVDRMPREVR